jgi:hypothetical protein
MRYVQYITESAPCLGLNATPVGDAGAGFCSSSTNSNSNVWPTRRIVVLVAQKFNLSTKT